VAPFAPTMATCLAWPLIDGPASFEPGPDPSPACSEIRVVFGVQLVARRQVSRINTWRWPLLLPLAPQFGNLIRGMAGSDRQKTPQKRPEELTEGRMLSVPTNAPFSSVEMSCVDGLAGISYPRASIEQIDLAAPGGECSTKFVAAELKAT